MKRGERATLGDIGNGFQPESEIVNIDLAVTEKRLNKLEHRVDELEETLEIMSDKKLMKSIERGLKDFKQGKYTTHKDVNPMFSDSKDKD